MGSERLKKEFVRNCFLTLHSHCFLLLSGAKEADSKLVNQRMTGCQFKGLLHLKPRQVGQVAVIPAGETARRFRFSVGLLYAKRGNCARTAPEMLALWRTCRAPSELCTALNCGLRYECVEAAGHLYPISLGQG